MNRAYSINQWQRDFAAAFAAATPMEPVETQARGALLAADNDEPEPPYSEEQLIEIDKHVEMRKLSDALRTEREERAHWDEVQRRPNSGFQS